MSELDAPDGRSEVAEAYAALSAALWDVRGALETLLFRLSAEQLIVASGATRWLNRADDDVRAAIDRMRVSELARAIETEALARATAAPPESTLRELAAVADEPWSELLTEHRDALRSLTAEVQAVAADNRRLLDAGARAIAETLDHLGSAVATYDATGVAVGRHHGPFLIDEQA